MRYVSWGVTRNWERTAFSVTMRFTALSMARIVDSTVSVEAPMPRYCCPSCSTSSVTSPKASRPIVALRTRKSLQTTLMPVIFSTAQKAASIGPSPCSTRSVNCSSPCCKVNSTDGILPVPLVTENDASDHSRCDGPLICC